MNRYLIVIIFSALFFHVNAQNEPNDCVDAIVVCGNSTFLSNATGPGDEDEISSCNSTEHNSLWLEVNIVQDGQLGFDLIPNDPDIMVDYDFWVFGANRSCTNLGNPIRCAMTNPDAAGLADNHTGIDGSTTMTQTGAGDLGAGYVYWLDVTAGESYYIVIDRPHGDGGFEIQWTGTATEGAGAFPETPVANEIDDITHCSTNPVISVFDLNGLKPSINSDPNNTIEFYANLADATDGINQLPPIYANVTNPQTIYAKVVSLATECYSLVDFDLIISEIPEATLSVSDTDICEGEDVTFTITGTPGANIVYNIDSGASQELLLDNTGVGTITENPTGDFTFNLEEAQVLNASGGLVCFSALSDSEDITVYSNTIPTVTHNSPICEDEDGVLEFSGDPDATITYTVDGGAEQTFNLDTTGNYTLTLLELTEDTTIEIISVTSALPPYCEQTLNITETIVVYPSPDVTITGALVECSDGINPNSAVFDLDAAREIILDEPDPSIIITYFETQALSLVGDPADALVSPYSSTSAYQIIYVRLETDLGCVRHTVLSLQVVDAPIANTPSDLVSCDANNLGIGMFDLTQAEAEVIAGNTQTIEVSYYSLETEAEAGTPSITNPSSFENTEAYNQTVYVRVDVDGMDCYNITPLNLEVFDTPIITTPDDLETCDDNTNDGLASFDLEAQTPIILDGALDITITYHSSQLDAENNDAALTSPYINDSNNQTIFVRAENDLNTDCITTTTFNLIVNPLPEITTPTPLEVCDDGTPDGSTEMDLSLKNAEITGNNPNYAISYYLNVTDAASETSPLPSLYTNISSGQLIIARVDDINTGCYTTTTLELLVAQAPAANSPTPFEFCDPDSDGFGFFDLSTKDDEITGGDPTLGVSYHETMADAENNVNAIASSPYYNIVQNAQTLYARVESSTILTDCDSIVTLELIVNPTPQLGAAAPEPLEVCDDSAADGFAQFDLTSKTPEILQNLADPTLFTVTFYINEEDADEAINAIANATNYTNTTAFNQTLWIRVEDTASGCYKLTTLELIVNEIPVLVQPAPLVLCDDNNPGDEVEAFTLEAASNDILNGQSGISLSFFETQQDIDNNTNPISSPYTNTENPQTVFVKATNNETGCVSTTLLTLRVEPIPSPIAPADLEVCDDDTDGFASFNLEERTQEIAAGELDVEITYHETLEEAYSGVNAFESPYTNIVINQQTLYVRATNTVTGCYNASETLMIRVLETPQVPTAIDEIIACDSDNNSITQFDLTTKDSEIIGGQTDVTLTYHISETDALSGNNPITNPGNYTNATSPQTIYVRLENNTNVCFDIGTFEISVALPPEAIQTTPLELCDDDVADEITVFDLTEKNNEITGGQGSWSVTYYETLADAQAQDNVIPDPTQYTNTSINGQDANPQTLYAVVTDTNTGCTDMVTLTIRVLPNPTPTASAFLPTIERCDDVNTGDGVEEFDLTENEMLIQNGEVGVTITYHETQNEANSGTNAIVDPTAYSNTTPTEQEIYVRMTKDATGCYALVDFTIVVHPLPSVVAVTDFIQCELFTDGIDSFDLSSKDVEVLNGQDATQFIVSYHATLADAEAGINGLVSPYTNTVTPETIYVTITNNETGCSISTQSFDIEVQEAAQANPDMEPILQVTCDDNMETDGDPTDDSAQFDLTENNDAVLDSQNPDNYIVSYYATEEEANLMVNPLPTLYENVVNPQIIYARVDNDTPDGAGADSSICYAIAELTLQVNPLPELYFEEEYTLCLNTDDSEVLEPLVIDTGLSAADYSFVWHYEGTEMTGETGPSIMPTQGGIYDVFVTNLTTGCENDDITEVFESEPPSIIRVELLSQTFADNHIIEVILGEDEIGDYEYSLDYGPWQDEPLFSNVIPGQHEVRARDKNGCGITEEPIFVIDYPLYFTPNGDGQNETWNIEGIGSSAKIYIFDRYGKLLKQLSPDGEGWDGTFNNSPLPTSDYWFTVEYDEPMTNIRKEFKAHFTLKR